MDFNLDKLLNFPNATVESCSIIDEVSYFQIRWLNEKIELYCKTPDAPSRSQVLPGNDAFEALPLTPVRSTNRKQPLLRVPRQSHRTRETISSIAIITLKLFTQQLVGQLGNGAIASFLHHRSDQEPLQLSLTQGILFGVPCMGAMIASSIIASRGERNSNWGKNDWQVSATDCCDWRVPIGCYRCCC